MAIEALHLDFETRIDAANKITADARSGVREARLDEGSNVRPSFFDWACGVILPLICVAADPIVFRNDGDLLSTYRPFAYLLSAASIFAMTAWLLWGPKLRWLAAALSGLFYVGAAVSLLVGIVLFPLSLFGVVFSPISLLGFTPLLSTVVFIRHGRRAYKASLAILEDETASKAAILAALFSFVIPYAINVQVVRAVDDIAGGDVNTIRSATAKLKFVAPLADLGPVAAQYYSLEESEKYSPRAEELGRAYKELSGRNIDDAPPSRWD